MTTSDNRGNLHAGDGKFTEKAFTDASGVALKQRVDYLTLVQDASRAADEARHKVRTLAVEALEAGVREKYPTATAVAVMHDWNRDDEEYAIQHIDGPDGRLFDLDHDPEDGDYNYLNRFVAYLGGDAGAYLDEFDPENEADFDPEGGIRGNWARLNIE